MAKADSTYAKRTVKKRAGLGSLPEPVKSAAKDVVSGFGELKRQSGAAVENVKRGYRKVKESMK